MNEVKSRILKTPADSETVMTEVVCPNDTNPMGMLQGGRLVQWMDIAGAVCAQEHAERICVTSGIHSLRFKLAARVGDIVTINARITRAFNSSMEIHVKAWRKNIISGNKDLINNAYFTFVALDAKGRPVPVAGLVPTNGDEEIAYQEALARRNAYQPQHDSHTH
jgi:acyl-CoA hydrolase